MEDEGDSNTNSSWCTWNSSQCHVDRTRGIGNQWNNLNYQDYSIDEISHITKKSPGDVKRLAITDPSREKPQPNSNVKRTG